MLFLLLAVIILSLAGQIAANAADLSSSNIASAPGYAVYGLRTEPVIIYDYEPGVIVRSYWYPPWNNRHYFPRTGRRPKSGRLEHISARGPTKAEDYFRFWGTSSGFPIEPPPTNVRPYAVPPAPPVD